MYKSIQLKHTTIKKLDKFIKDRNKDKIAPNDYDNAIEILFDLLDEYYDGIYDKI